MLDALLGMRDHAAECGRQPAREWRSDDALLRPLSDQLPAVTLDDLISRASEFAAGSGPYWLHGTA
ncbi:MAG: hypothetical protein ACHQ4H_09470, partial [Ktedonobacterales bacterium]